MAEVGVACAMAVSVYFSLISSATYVTLLGCRIRSYYGCKSASNHTGEISLAYLIIQRRGGTYDPCLD